MNIWTWFFGRNEQAELAAVPGLKVSSAHPPPQRKRGPAVTRVHTEAARLLNFCADSGVDGVVLAAEMQRLYAEMCATRRIRAIPWQTISPEITRITSGRKDYRWFYEADGRHRRRVFLLTLKPTPHAEVNHLRVPEHEVPDAQVEERIAA